ncbi:MAG: hypothetical protein ACTSV3_08105 [Candidatus Thorarchaeota archaeon]|nr:MAG: hypothetical protein DRP09_06945 [Candidatus Thorarchaeota archaeon]
MARDPNFLLILVGAIIWFIGYYVLLFGPLFLTVGFALVCFAAARTALSRPVTNAWPAILLGGLIQVVGFYFAWILILGPAAIVTGGVMIVFYALPLALQKGDLPIVKELEKAWTKQTTRQSESEQEKEVKGTPAEDAESTKVEEDVSGASNY